MPVKKLKEFLDNHHVKYTSTFHSPAFTAQEIAASSHVSGKHLAKVVIIKDDGRFVMVVLPANDHINFAKLSEKLGMKEINLAKESEFKDKFPGCEVGAMPPFGNLYDMPVFVDSKLTQEDQIAFCAGSHSELIQLSFQDFSRLVNPKIIG